MTVIASQVRAIYPTAPAAADLTPFITVATNFVTPLLLNKGLTDAFIDAVILYVTAHLLELTYERGGLTRKRMGDSDESFKSTSDFDVGLKFTRFGQMAMILDSTGTLAAASASSGLKALFEVV